MGKTNEIHGTRSRPVKSVRSGAQCARSHTLAKVPVGAASRAAPGGADVWLDSPGLLLRRFLGPRIAERGGAIEDWCVGFRINRISEEVAEALELEVLAGAGGGEGRFELGVAEDREGVGIDVVEEGSGLSAEC